MNHLNRGLPEKEPLPIGWQPIRLKFLAEMRSGNGITSADIEADGPFPVYGGNGLRGFTNRFTHRGSFVLIGRQGAHCGNVHHVSGKFWSSEHAVVSTMRPPNCSRWFAHLLYAMNLNQYSVSAAQPGLAVDRIRELTAPVPPPSAQRAIADFLDRKTAAIDALVEKKRKLLDLLAEKRSALINQAVTKGLDPNVRMKDSSIPWIGQIPAHWKVKRLKDIVSMAGGSTPSKANDAYWIDGTVPWVTPKDMKRFWLADSIDHVTDLALAEGRLSLLPPGVVLVVVRGMILARTFPVAVTAGPVTVNQDMKALIAERSIRPEFLGRYLAAQSHAVSSIVEEAGHGTRVLRLDLLGSFPVVVPPVVEQRRLAQQIDDRATRLLEGLNTLGGSIDRLLEYRQALITAAVTGQLDIGGENAA